MMRLNRQSRRQSWTRMRYTKISIDGPIAWPERVAQQLAGWAPLSARIVVGWVCPVFHFTTLGVFACPYLRLFFRW